MVALCQLLIGAMSQDSPCDCDNLEKDIVELQKANDDIRMNLNILTSVMNIRRIQQVSGFECSRVLRSKSIRFLGAAIDEDPASGADKKLYRKELSAR